jgi:hypothetical protein
MSLNAQAMLGLDDFDFLAQRDSGERHVIHIIDCLHECCTCDLLTLEFKCILGDGIVDFIYAVKMDAYDVGALENTEPGTP